MAPWTSEVSKHTPAILASGPNPTGSDGINHCLRVWGRYFWGTVLCDGEWGNPPPVWAAPPNRPGAAGANHSSGDLMSPPREGTHCSLALVCQNSGLSEPSLVPLVLRPSELDWATTNTAGTPVCRYPVMGLLVLHNPVRPPNDSPPISGSIPICHNAIKNMANA